MFFYHDSYSCPNFLLLLVYLILLLIYKLAFNIGLDVYKKNITPESSPYYLVSKTFEVYNTCLWSITLI